MQYIIFIMVCFCLFVVYLILLRVVYVTCLLSVTWLVFFELLPYFKCTICTFIKTSKASGKCASNI